VQVRLPDQDRSGFLQPSRNLGIFERNAIVEHRASRRGAHARRVDIVFEGDRNAMQRAAQSACALLRIKIARLGQRLLPHHGDEGVEFGIEGFDSGETGFRELGGGDGARPHAA